MPRRVAPDHHFLGPIRQQLQRSQEYAGIPLPGRHIAIQHLRAEHRPRLREKAVQGLITLLARLRPVRRTIRNLPEVLMSELPARPPQHPRLVSANQAAETLIRFQPINILHAVVAQDVQKARRQQHLAVRPPPLTPNTGRQIAERSTWRRRTEPQLHAAIRRHGRSRVRKIDLDRRRGIGDHFSTRLVKVFFAKIPCNPLLEKGQSGSTPKLDCG